MFQQGAFLIDANQTPEQIARKRLAIAAMMPRFGSARNVGEGLGQLGTGILMGIGDYQANRDEAAGRAQGDSAFNAFLERMGGSGQPDMGTSPSAQPSVSGSVPVAAQNNDPVSARVAEGWSPFAPQQNNAYADAIASIESAGSGDYSAVGPTHSKLGRALGRYQVMEANVGPWSKEALGREVTADEFLANPQIQDQVFNNQFGRYVDQYGPEGAAQAWFAGPGGVGKLDRQDSLGTSVAAYTDKFRNALGNQTASATPMAPSGISSNPTADLAMALRARQENAGQTAINGAVQAPAPQMMAQAAPVQPQMQQPQAQPSQAPQMSLQELYQLSANPFLSDQQRGVVNMMLQQQMQANDPLRQMQLERGRLELEQMRNPGVNPVTVGQGQALVDPATGRVIFQGEQRSAELPGSVREYEYAKQQGFPGTFQDWEASKKGGMSLQVDPSTGQVILQQGGNMKPLTETQSRDAVYSTRAEGAMTTLDQYESALSGVRDNVAGSVPVVGNMLTSSEFQRAEQAGTEFLQAILRKDTGAAITAQERSEYGKVYLPRPGDSPETILQKKQSRLRALEAIKAGMPPQAILSQEKALEKSGSSPYGGDQSGTPQKEPTLDDLLKQYGGV